MWVKVDAPAKRGPGTTGGTNQCSVTRMSLECFEVGSGIVVLKEMFYGASLDGKWIPGCGTCQNTDLEERTIHHSRHNLKYESRVCEIYTQVSVS